MKIMTMTAAIVLSLGSAGAIADNSTLVSLESDSSVIQLTDMDLATVQGGWGWGDVCFACSNIAVVTQLNLSLGSLGVLQSNASEIVQSNN